jgi:hypothetical protein
MMIITRIFISRSTILSPQTTRQPPMYGTTRHNYWFLSSGVTGDHHTQVRRAASARNRHRAADAAWRDQQRDSDLQKAAAPQDKADDAVAAEPPAAPQVTPSVQQSSESLVPHSVPTIAYRVIPPSAQTVSGPTAAARANTGCGNALAVLMIIGPRLHAGETSSLSGRYTERQISDHLDATR